VFPRGATVDCLLLLKRSPKLPADSTQYPRFFPLPSFVLGKKIAFDFFFGSPGFPFPVSGFCSNPPDRDRIFFFFLFHSKPFAVSGDPQQLWPGRVPLLFSDILQGRRCPVFSALCGTPDKFFSFFSYFSSFGRNI